MLSKNFPNRLKVFEEIVFLAIKNCQSVSWCIVYARHAYKTEFWSILGVPFKIYDDHFYMGVPLPPCTWLRSCLPLAIFSSLFLEHFFVSLACTRRTFIFSAEECYHKSNDYNIVLSLLADIFQIFLGILRKLLP